MVQGEGRGTESGAAREKGESYPGNSLLLLTGRTFQLSPPEEKPAGFSCHSLGVS